MSFTLRYIIILWRVTQSQVCYPVYDMSLNLRYVTLCMTCHAISGMLPCVWHVIWSQVCYPVYDVSLCLRWHKGHVQQEHTWTHPHQPAQNYNINSVSEGVTSLALRLLLLNLLGFHREWLVEELLVEVLLDVVHQDAGDALVVELGPARTTHHLQNVWNQNRTDHHNLHNFSGTWTDLKSEIRTRLTITAYTTSVEHGQTWSLKSEQDWPSQLTQIQWNVDRLEVWRLTIERKKTAQTHSETMTEQNSLTWQTI